MGRERKDYEKYRPALTPEQQGQLAAAKSDKEKRELYMEFAKKEAQSQLESGGPYSAINVTGFRKDALPEDETLYERYPDVDPHGHYSELDMAFTRRRQAIDAVLNPHTSAWHAVQDIFGSIPVDSMMEGVDNLARNQRIYTRAEKLCHDDAAKELHRIAQSFHSMEDAVDLERVFTGVEYMLGIRKEQPSKDVLQLFDEKLGYKLTPEFVAECRSDVHPPERFNVTFPDFEKKLACFQFTQPENWGKDRKSYEPLGSSQVMTLATGTASAVADKALDALYGTLERSSPARQQGNMAGALHRYHYLLIDGKRAIDLVREKHKDSYIRNESTFLASEGLQYLGEMVSAALTSGKRVEAFIPDANGKLPDEPVRLTQTGFEPARLSPVSLNAWEKFWNKFGFYKEKAAQAEDNARFSEGREQIRTDAQKTHDYLMGRGEDPSAKAPDAPAKPAESKDAPAKQPDKTGPVL